MTCVLTWDDVINKKKKTIFLNYVTLDFFFFFVQWRATYVTGFFVFCFYAWSLNILKLRKPFNNGCSIPQMKQRYQGDDIPCILNQGKSTLSLAGLKKRKEKKSKTNVFVAVQSPVLRLCSHTRLMFKEQKCNYLLFHPRPAEVAVSLSQSERCSNSLLFIWNHFRCITSFFWFCFVLS